MDNSALIQKQIKDNTEDLHNFVRDLKLWEEEMKRKDRQLSNDKNEEILPPVRRAKVPKKTPASKPNHNDSTKKRIPSYDYKTWDNFDVEKACEEIDSKDNENESEDENENEEEKIKQEEKYMREKSLYEKEMGNKYVKASKWDEAIESYTRAIAAYSRDPIFYANRALCYLKKKKYEAAEADCQASLKLDSTYVKAYLRCAAAQEALQRYEDARHNLRRALQLEPHNQQAQCDLTRLANLNTKKEKEVLKTKETETKPGIQKEPTSYCVNNKGTAGMNSGVTVNEPSSEPEFWPLPSTSSTILPVNKPPHLRSKKPLKRIEIHDVGLNTPKHVCARLLQNSPETSTTLPISVKPLDLPGTSAPPKLSMSSQDLPGTSISTKLSVSSEDLPGSITPSNSSSLVQLSTGAKPRFIHTLNSPLTNNQTSPPPPKTSVQFHTYWNGIKTDRNLCYQFLKLISGDELADIFKESLESKMFSNIVQILASEFTVAGDKVIPYLQGLSRVRRFSTLTLFMSPEDKTNLKALFDYCTHQNEGSPEEINRLRIVYELV